MREAIERGGHAVEHGLLDGGLRQRGEAGRGLLGGGDQGGDQRAPFAAVGVGRHRKEADVAPVIGERERPAGAEPEAVADAKLAVELGQPRRPGYRKTAARHRLDVEIGDLVEPAGEKLPAGIARERPLSRAAGEGQNEARPQGNGGRPQIR